MSRDIFNCHSYWGVWFLLSVKHPTESTGKPHPPPQQRLNLPKTSTVPKLGNLGPEGADSEDGGRRGELADCSDTSCLHRLEEGQSPVGRLEGHPGCAGVTLWKSKIGHVSRRCLKMLPSNKASLTKACLACKYVKEMLTVCVNSL